MLELANIYWDSTNPLCQAYDGINSDYELICELNLEQSLADMT